MLRMSSVHCCFNAICPVAGISVAEVQQGDAHGGKTHSQSLDTMTESFLNESSVAGSIKIDGSF